MTAPENPIANAQFTRVTDWEGTEGRRGNFAGREVRGVLSDREGKFDIWLSQMGSGTFLQSHSGDLQDCNR